MRLGMTLARDIFVNDATLHNENDAAHRGDIFEWVAIERDDVGFVARRDGADAVTHAHRFGGKRVCRNHGAHRINARIAHTIDELLLIVAVRTRDSVRTEDDFESRNLDRTAPDTVVGRTGSR